MTFKHTFLLLILLHGTMCCEVDWGCNRCVQQDCHYVVTNTGNTVCVEDGVFYPEIDRIIKYEILCGKFDHRRAYTDRPVYGSHSIYKFIHAKVDHEYTHQPISPTTASPILESTTSTMQQPTAPTSTTVLPTSAYWSQYKAAENENTWGSSISSKTADEAEISVDDGIPSPSHTTAVSDSTINLAASNTVTQAIQLLRPPQINSTSALSSAATDGSYKSIVKTHLTTQSPLHSIKTPLKTPNISKSASTAITEATPSQSPQDKATASVFIASDHAFPLLPSTSTPSPQLVAIKTSKMIVNVSRMSDGRQQQQRDMAYKLPDHMELFSSFHYTTDCEKESRNETLLFNYVSSLCSISKIVDRVGIDSFDEIAKGWFYLNPARRYPGTCKAIRYVRKKCRVVGPRKTPSLQPTLKYGPPSPLFSSIQTSLTCNEKDKRELAAHRLARLMCYSGSLFMEVQHSIIMNNFDFGFGTSNISFRYQFKCKALYYRKRHCFNQNE